jgi:hypothetical protein
MVFNVATLEKIMDDGRTEIVPYFVFSEKVTDSEYILPPVQKRHRLVDSEAEEVSTTAKRRLLIFESILNEIRGPENSGEVMGQGEIYSRISDEVAEAVAVDLGMKIPSVKDKWKRYMHGQAVEINGTRYMCETVLQGGGAKSLWTLTPMDDSGMTFPKVAS